MIDEEIIAFYRHNKPASSPNYYDRTAYFLQYSRGIPDFPAASATLLKRIGGAIGGLSRIVNGCLNCCL